MLYRLAAGLLLFHLVLPVWAQSLQTDSDWARTGAEAEHRALPVVILVTDHNCGFCERMRHEFLLTPQTRTLLEDGAVTREFQRNSGGKVTDFDGERVRTRIFLSRYNIFATPTLLILDPSGKPLAQALVGYNNAQSYAHMVSQRLEQARTLLGANRQTTQNALARADR